MNMRYRKKIGIAALVCVGLLVSLADACPTCKDGIAEGARHAGMVRGYFWSILFMMSMPFLIFGGLGTYFYIQVRRARLDQAKIANPSRGEGSHSAYQREVVSS